MQQLKVSHGILYYLGKAEKRDWRVVVKSQTEKKRIMNARHSNAQGACISIGHFIETLHVVLQFELIILEIFYECN